MNEGELSVRQSVLSRIEALIKEHIPQASVFMFGSTANRLALPGSDIDVLVCTDHVTMSQTCNLLYECVLAIIKKSGEFDEIEPIKTAAVPIIQARHKKTGVSLDLVIDREDGLQGLCLVMSLQETYCELRPLYLIMKAFLCNKNVHKPWKGGIGSFVLINLLTSYLQHMIYKPRANGKLSHDLGLHEMVVGFLRFISEEFRSRRTGLSILFGGYAFDRNDESLRCGDSIGAGTPMIMSPLSPVDDLGTSVRCFSKIIRPLFETAANALVKWTSEGPQPSFIELLIPEARKLRGE